MDQEKRGAGKVPAGNGERLLGKETPGESGISNGQTYSDPMLVADANIKDLQDVLSHDRLATTGIYLHALEEDAKEGQRLLAQARATGRPELKQIKGGK